MPSANSPLSPYLEMAMSETPVPMNGKKDNSNRDLETLQEGIVARIWTKYGVTSTQCRVELICTVNKTIQMILDLS